MGLAQTITQLPRSSGVYIMKDARGVVLYVGKAVSLRSRVQSYFRKNPNRDVKTQVLVGKVASIEHIETESEAEALIREAALVKEYRPKYNIDLKDDKSYPYIEVTQEAFPRISVCRPREKKSTCRYFGPYVNAKLMREALTIIRRIFPFRTCQPMPKTACLDQHMQLCEAPCVGGVDQKTYARAIKKVMLLLEGKQDAVQILLREEMHRSSAAHAFEEAARLRDQLRAVGSLYSGTNDVNYYKEAEQLKRACDLPRLPERIEAFDISTIMGEQSVGSMVSFLNGVPDKSQYRRFKIKQVTGLDDFQMIAEVVTRRYRRLKTEGSAFPDLIVIDGGKGQLSAACHALRVVGVSLPIVSLAKREEEVFLPGKRDAVRLSRNSLGLHLLQRLRDEAHRFAVSYHRVLRKKKAFA